jgi:molybdate transport system substrate-binding protein
MDIRQSLSSPITGISSMATRSLLADLTEQYQRLTGQCVAIESIGGVAAARRVENGEPFDIIVLAADAIERLAAAGHVDAGSRVDVARSGVAIAVKSGARRPAIGTQAEVRDAILAARTIGYSTGPSGAHLIRLFERWGIAEVIAPRVVQAPPGVPVATLVARGEVELGFQQLSELMNVPGIDVIGPLPDEIQIITVFSAAIGVASSRGEAAKALLSFLTSSRSEAVKFGYGMEPA